MTPPEDKPAPFEESKDEESKADESKGEDEGGSDWRTWSGRSINP
jgi:hypothetical protein